MRALLAIGLLGIGATSARAQSAGGVTVFLESDGIVIERSWDGSLEGIAIPRFGGTAGTWAGLVTCVREKFAPFDVEVVEQRPEHGPFITAVVGGHAEQLGYDGSRVAGVGVVDVTVTRDAVVHVFSKSVGERDARQLCNVAAHEIGHAMGLDHSMQCGDVMSYPRQDCGPARAESFIDADKACGEYAERSCHTGEATQNSFQRLAELVGLRHTVTPEVDAEAEADAEPTSPENPFTSEVENPFTPEVENPFTPEVDSSFTPEVDSSFTPEVQEPQQPASCSSHRQEPQRRRRWRRVR